MIKAEAKVILEIGDDAIKEAARGGGEENIFSFVFEINESVVLDDGFRLLLVFGAVFEECQKERLLWFAFLEGGAGFPKIREQKLFRVKRAGVLAGCGDDDFAHGG